MGKIRDVLRIFVPSATAFFLGTVVAALGLVASRLVAAALGSSFYTWTSILGILLAGLSCGSYLGGRTADRYHLRRALAALFALASAACVATIMFNHLLAAWSWPWRLSWPAHVLLHTALLLFVPSLLLGATAPLVLKMALNQTPTPGRAVGVLGAWGAAGSVVGVILTGFRLIPSYGSLAMIWMIGAALLAMAVVLWISCWAFYLWAMIFATLATMGMAPAQWAREAGVGSALRQADDPNVIHETETCYGSVIVRRMSERPDRHAWYRNGRRIDEIMVDRPGRLHRFTAEVCAGLTGGLAGGRSRLSMLVIDDAGGGFARYLKARWPDSTVQLIEIDPGVTEAMGEADRSVGIGTVNTDARYYLNRRQIEGGAEEAKSRRHFIYVDLVGRDGVPFPYVTREFNEGIAERLTEDGAYMLSLIDTTQGGRLLGAAIGTLEQTFSHLHVIADDSRPSSSTNSFVVVASEHAFDAERFLYDHDEFMRFRLLDAAEITRLKGAVNFLVLTDDFAPVEHLLTPAVRERAAERLACRYVREAERLFAQQRYDASVWRYEQAAQLDPSVALEARSRAGAIRLAQHKLTDAAEVLRKAVDADDHAALQKVALASAHMNLGITLGKMGRKAGAKEHLNEAAKWFRRDLERYPDSVVCWERLGETLALTGDRRGASDAFARAMALEPKNVAHYERLAELLEDQRRYGEAISVARRHVVLLKELGRRDLALQMGAYVDYLEYQKVKQRR